jgi:uncharacterized membrane-anchored protein YitT (DUF2179 family)
MKYSIYTENKNKELIEQVISEYFDGFTIIESVGYWKGTKESGLIIEIICSDNMAVYRLAEDIKTLNKQESVLVTWTNVDSQFI